jgi:hypothetical protein
MIKLGFAFVFATSTLMSAGLASSATAQAAPAKIFAKVCNNGSMEGTGVGGRLCPRNPVQGPRPDQWGCTLDRATNLLWEIKTIGGLTNYNSRFSNFDALVAGQLGNGTSPTPAQINFATNSVGYVNAINIARLCRHVGWQRPTLPQLQSAATSGTSPQLPVAFFPDLGFQATSTQFGPTITSTPTFNNPTAYQGFRISNGSIISANRLGAYPVRLVTTWIGRNPCGGEGQESCKGG